MTSQQASEQRAGKDSTDSQVHKSTSYSDARKLARRFALPRFVKRDDDASHLSGPVHDRLRAASSVYTLH